MKRIACCAAVVIGLGAGPPAGAAPWNKSLDANLTMTQNAYSDSWTGGETGSLSWTFNSNGLFERQIGPKLNTRNTLTLFYGQTHTQNGETRRWAAPVTSTDRIDLESVFRFTLQRLVDPYASARIETQFRDVSDPMNKRFLNPALFTESAGAAKELAKAGKREWIVRLGGAFRQRLDRDALDRSTGATHTKTDYDAGVLLASDFTTPLADTTITVTSRLSVYQAFYNSEAKKLEGAYNMDYWKSPDVNWEASFTASITKYLMVNLYAQLLYDKEVALAGRFRENLSLGVTYKLM
jgi:hypothetical protein